VQDCFKYLGHRPEDFQESVEAAATTLALPIYPELKREHLEAVVQKIKEFLVIRA
jgi:dTDP-4-amino-4,6-dideoxygalactose transaminase